MTKIAFKAFLAALALLLGSCVAQAGTTGAILPVKSAHKTLLEKFFASKRIFAAPQKLATLIILPHRKPASLERFLADPVAAAQGGNANQNNYPGGGTTFSSGNPLGPIINGKFPSVLCPLCNASGTTQQVQDAHMANGSSTLTSATANFKASDANATAWLIANNTTIELSPSVVKIASVVNSTTVTLSVTNANADCGGTNCFFTWGPDTDQAAINAAITAGLSNSLYFTSFLGQIPQIFFPAGGYMLDSCMNMQPASSSAYGASLVGDPGGTSTTFFTRPDITGSCGAIALLFGGQHNVMKDVIFNGSNVMYNSGAPNDYVGAQCAECTIEDVYVHWTGYNSGGTPGGALSMNTSGGVGRNINIINSGVRQGSNSASNNMKGCRIVGGAQTVWHGGVCSNFQTAANMSVEQVTPNDNDGLSGGAAVEDVLVDECANSAGRGCTEQINSKNVRWVNTRHWSATGGAQYAFYMDGTSQGTFSGVNVGPYNGTTNGKGLIILSGGRVDSGLSTFRCFGTDNCINNAGTFNDMPCGNHFAGNSSANYAGAGVIYNCPLAPIVPKCLLASAVSPLACGASGSGKVAVPATTTTYTINTTAVVSPCSPVIIPTQDNSGIPGSPALAVVASPFAQVTACVPGTSFTFSLPSNAGISGFIWTLQ